jgi:F-type H+-transporting ATPase subunit a
MNDIFTFFGLISHSHSFIFMAHMLLSAVAAIIIARMAISNLRLVPTGTQNVVEAYLEGVMAMGKDTMNKRQARKYLPLVATIGLFVFCANVIGMIPGFEAPSSSLNFTLALALIVFIYYNFEGIRQHGVISYFKHFMGPVWWLAWLMFPIEVISHFSRIISLSFRLFGNVKGDDMFLLVVLMLAPWILPILPFGIIAGEAVLQTFIFMILTYVYIGGAIALNEEDH